MPRTKIVERRVNVGLPREQARQVEALAEKFGVKLSDVVRECVLNGLENTRLGYGLRAFQGKKEKELARKRVLQSLEDCRDLGVPVPGWLQRQCKAMEVDIPADLLKPPAQRPSARKKRPTRRKKPVS